MKYYIDNYKLIYIQLIRSPVNCNDQFFHLNYNGDCSTYIIPLTEFNKLNGTKYLFFYDELNYEKYFYYLLKLSDEVLNDEDIISKLYDIGLIYEKDYIFNNYVSDEYSLITLPNYVLHRGVKNKTNNDRLAFFICFSLKNSYDYKLYDTDKEIIQNDTEVDEDLINETLVKNNRIKYNIN